MAEIDKKIGRKIRKLRKSWGLSQIELAEKIGLSFQQVQKYEKGFTTMSVFRLNQISDALGVHINTFFEEEEQIFKVSGPVLEYSSEKAVPETFPPLDKEEIACLKYYRKLSNSKLRQGFLKQLKEIVKLERKQLVRR